MIFTRACQTQAVFNNHYKIDEAKIELEIDEGPPGKFRRCTKCNFPTIKHDKPIDEGCTKVALDEDDIIDIEVEMRENNDFQNREKAAVKAAEKRINADKEKEARTCDECKKVFKTITAMKSHVTKTHESESAMDPTLKALLEQH